MLSRVLVSLLGVFVGTAALAADGLVVVSSPYRVQETMDRLEMLVKARDFTVFARIDHAAGAQRVGKMLRPTELLIFGNPRGGTPLMECQQSVGIDLPLKILVWEDEAGRVSLGYNDPAYLAARHQVTTCGQVVQTMQNALMGIAKEVTTK
jgi:uncharacterized protein (DUF302 family)